MIGFITIYKPGGIFTIGLCRKEVVKVEVVAEDAFNYTVKELGKPRAPYRTVSKFLFMEEKV